MARTRRDVAARAAPAGGVSGAACFADIYLSEGMLMKVQEQSVATAAKGGTVEKSRRYVPQGRGRKIGSHNKSTQRAREAVAVFVEGNVDRLQGWLDEIARQDGPRAAFKCFCDVLGYHIPKLARATFVGEDDRELIVNLLRFTELPVEGAEEKD